MKAIILAVSLATRNYSIIIVVSKQLLTVCIPMMRNLSTISFNCSSNMIDVAHGILCHQWKSLFSLIN